MELNNLLNALVQGSETTTLGQIESKSATPTGGNATGQPDLPIPGSVSVTLSTAASTAPSASLPGQNGLSLTDPFSLSLGGQGAPGEPGSPSLAGLDLSGQTGTAQSGTAGQAGAAGQSGAELGSARVTSGAGAGALAQRGGGLAQSTAGGLSQPGSGVVPPGRGLPALVGAASQLARVQQRASFTSASAAGATEDIYHGAGAPASASLLSQSGIGAYIHLLSALASNESDQKSANLLTNNLGNASATLRATYSTAVATLSPQLQQKDWSFSVVKGVLVFTAGKDSLSTQDLAELQKAFANADVATSAREVAATISSIQAQRQAGADAGSLAWGALGADDTNSGGVDLRGYVTTTVPGGNYHPVMPDPASNPTIPALLGGMDLRELVSSRPDFFRPDGRVVTDAEEDPVTEAEDPPVGTLRGQCSCGQVEFVVENTFEYAFYCHCSRCRARTGSAFAAIAGIATDKLEVIAGSDHLLIEGECADGYGARCNLCHAFLFAAVRERQYLHVALGVLSGSPNRLPDHHIYVGSKAPWFEITDELPQYEELPEPKSL